MLKKLTSLLLFAAAIAFSHTNAFASYYADYQITALDTTNGAMTLSDGSTWKIQDLSLPIAQAWTQGGGGWLIPVYQFGDMGDSVAVIFLYGSMMPALCNIKTGSTSLQITSINVATRSVVLSDGSTWTLDSHFQSYYSTWAVGDPVTVTGHKYLNFLINGSDKKSSYSAASKASSLRKKR